MVISYVRLQQFRSYIDGSFEFDTGVNIIVGPNASGKTSLLEAIIVCLQGSSFKARDAELLYHNSQWGRIDLGAEHGERTCKLQLQSEKLQKTFEIDDHVYKRLSHQKTEPIVLFEPNHLLLLHGSPELRRTFLDDLLSQLKPDFRAIRLHYKRVLAQRNALLKQIRQPSTDQLFVWNLRLSELGGRIVTERMSLLAQFNDTMSEIYSTIAGQKTTIELVYSSSLSTEQYETKLLHKLEQNIARDHAVGFTTHGPHREDITILINGQLASQTASRGEIRTILLSLKMLEAQFIETARSRKPLLLFDDVFSELDGKRRQALVSFLKPYQSLITTTDADVVVDHFSERANIIAL